MGSNRIPWTPYVAMMLTQLIYAGMALFTKAAVGSGMSPYVFVFYRQIFATLFLMPLTFFFERNKGLPKVPLVKIFLIAFLGDSLSSSLYTISLGYTSATFASASTNAIPSITLVLALLLRIERLSKKQKLYGTCKVLGALVCLAGAFLYALYKGPAVEFINRHSIATQEAATHAPPSPSSMERSISVSSAGWVKGCLIMLLGHTSWCIWLILQGPLVRSYPAELRLTVLQCFSSSIQTAVIAVIFQRNSSASAWKLGWNIKLSAALYCGVGTGICFWFSTWCVDRKGPVFTAAFTPLALIVTATYSTMAWKEIIHWGSVGGAFLLVVGLYFVLLGKSKEEKSSSQKPSSCEVVVAHEERDPENQVHQNTREMVTL